MKYHNSGDFEGNRGQAFERTVIGRHFADKDVRITPIDEAACAFSANVHRIVSFDVHYLYVCAANSDKVYAINHDQIAQIELI